MMLYPTTPHRWPGNPARRRPLLASTREDAPFRDGGTNLIREGRPRGIFSEARAHLPLESNMKSISNEMPGNSEPDAGPDKPSRAAEYITALYVALLLLTPWLLRDAPFFAPSKGVEFQMSAKSAPSAAPELKARATSSGQATNVPVRAD
jgi:hypothetical protein